jgi:hypothetical protein
MRGWGFCILVQSTRHNILFFPSCIRCRELGLPGNKIDLFFAPLPVLFAFCSVLHQLNNVSYHKPLFRINGGSAARQNTEQSHHE